jgi:hypothetical protein
VHTHSNVEGVSFRNSCCVAFYLNSYKKIRCGASCTIAEFDEASIPASRLFVVCSTKPMFSRIFSTKFTPNWPSIALSEMTFGTCILFSSDVLRQGRCCDRSQHSRKFRFDPFCIRSSVAQFLGQVL